MLSEFYLLEQYYDLPETTRFYEELSEKYGIEPVKKAIAAGDLIKRRIMMGPDTGRFALWLSDQGREKARNLFA